MANLMFENLPALLALPVLWLGLVLFAWRRRFQPFGPFILRLIIVVLAVLALARPVLPGTEIGEATALERTIIVVDQSLSLPELTRQNFRAEAARLVREAGRVDVLYFADQPVLVPFPTDPLLVEQGADVPLDSELSNLDAALTLSFRMLNGQPGRFILLSDGETLDPDRLEATLADLAAAGVPVDVVSTSTNFVTDPDLRLVNLSVPPLLREGETFDVVVTLHSPVAGPALLTVAQDNAPLAESDITLEPGLNTFSFEATAAALGPHTFEAAVSSDPLDAQPINTRFSAFSQVFPQPQLLIVGDEPVVVSRFRRWLEEAGFVVERIRSDQIPSRLSELEPYAGMVLLDVSARDLQLEQMIAVQEYVRSLGRGLLVTGGRNSFSLGEYEGTPLEDLLPLSLEPPPREERPPVALLLIIDHSGSMLEQEILSPTKLAMAKEAAIRATDILGPDDLIGVLIFDNQFEWVVPFRPASDGAELLKIQSRIATIAGGGGTRILQALQVGLPDLMAQDTFRGPRHAVLFSDGKSFDGFSTSGPDPYDAVIDAAVEAGVTLSTIAIGGDSDIELLARLAERGRGRYHFAGEPSELPELTISESDILRSSVVQEDGDYVPTVFAPHPMLRGLAGQSTLLPNEDRFEIPVISGYIGLTSKPQAEIALQVGPGDPLLGVWGYGLGRVAAWGSDIGNEWGREWLTWPDASRFWGQVIGYTLPAPNLGLLQLSATLEAGGVVTLVADGLTTTGQPVDLARTEASLVAPGGQSVPVRLRQVSPGRYQQRLRLPEPGAYQFTVNQARSDGPDETATIGFVLPYPAEYGLPTAGEALLAEIAEKTGGQRFALGEALSDQACDPNQDDCVDLNEVPSAETVALWPWLLQAALILWPLEIAWRRWRRLRIQ